MPRTVSATLWGPRRLTNAERRIERLEKIGPEVWVTVVNDIADPFGTYWSPIWQNSYAAVPGRRVQFRHGFDGQIDVVGQFDLTGGAVSGDVAFVLPPEWREESFEDFIPLELDDGVWSAAVIAGDAVTGEVILYWPIVADPIP